MPLMPPGFSLPKIPERAQLLLVLGVAVVCGAIASFSTLKYLKDKERALANAAPVGIVETSAVVVASQELKPGTAIERNTLDLVQWPKGHEPATSLQDVDVVVGRQVKGMVYPGEPILESRLVPKGEDGGMQVRIPVGMRAVSVKVDPVIGVSGFVQPGSRVDVVATLKRTGGESVSKMVLQNMLVLAAEHEVESDGDKPIEATTVTLAVTPEDAERLAMARAEGEVVLALRNLRDEAMVETLGFTASDIGGPLMAAKPEPSEEESAPIAEESMEPEPPPITYHTVQLIEAESSSDVKFRVQ